jgi:hypothetical protein
MRTPPVRSLPFAFLAAALAAQNPNPTPPAPGAPVAPAGGASFSDSTSGRATAPDDPAIAFFKQEALEKSQVMEHLSWMCDVYGPRLTGSPNLRKAQQWAQKTFMDWGLANAQLDKWGTFGRGWRCDHVLMEVTGDNPWPVIAYPKAWSPSLDGRVEADVVYVGGMQKGDLEAADLTGKIVLLQKSRSVAEPFDGISKRFDSEDLLSMADQRQDQRGDRRARAATAQTDFRAGFQQQREINRIVYAKHPLAVVDCAGKGDYGTVFVQGANVTPKPGADDANADPRQQPRVYDVGADVLPQFTIAVEHYDRMCRILQKGRPVRMALELKTSSFEQQLDEYDVTAEIPGTDPQLENQVVMLGGHFDSWHTGTGATDNGCGSAVAMEAVRLIEAWVKADGKGPRRTIRVALWSGEEEGLLGSRGYVKNHFGSRDDEGRLHTLPACAQVSGYFNLDNGTGKVRGVYLQGNDAVAPIFRQWLKPFHELGATTLTLNNTGGTDHLSFDAVGIPGFQFIQDPVSYDSRTHHSNMDVWDHVVADDLKQASAIVAAFVWQTAQRDEMLPRKAVPEVIEPRRQR